MKGLAEHTPGNGRAGGYVLITGGAGFVGANVADRLLADGERVLIFDNLSRAGVERNLAWLQETHGDAVSFQHGDLQDADALRRAVKNATSVFHFAAQVAVTSSLDVPKHDFQVNALGTFNLLEALRALPTPPPLLFTSTNKVYGCLAGLPLVEEETRYAPKDAHVRAHGIGEDQPLDFQSPYGCSKGAADQYVLEYARSFGLPAVVFRMSCIYGPHQFGTEDQGWVAHFLMRALEDQPITLYGDGKQVRDILFVEDLVEAMLLARTNAHRLAGHAFNIGGGVDRTVSLLELLDIMGELVGGAPALDWGGWRTGDQRYYVSDTSRFTEATGWRPTTTVREGLERLCDWLRSAQSSQAEAAAVDSREPVPAAL